MYRNFNLFPFQVSGAILHVQFLLIDLFGLLLRPTYSMLNTIASKTFLTSAIKILTWLLATTTKICTIARSKQDHSLYSSNQYECIYVQHTSLQVTTFFLLLLPFICLYTFSAINFQGYCICQVSCYTFLSEFQLPWPSSWCHHTTTLFMVSNNECTIGHI